MGTQVWEAFWDQVTAKREYYNLDEKSIFHYVVLEHLGYKPNEKPTELEKRRVRNLKRGTLDHTELESLYRNRLASYVGVVGYADIVNR